MSRDPRDVYAPYTFPDLRRRAQRAEQTTRAFPLLLKATSDPQGTFEGYVAVFGNLDGNGDVIDQGAFRKTLTADRAAVKARGGDTRYLYPLLWQHDETEPIGGITDASEDSHGLYIKGEYDLDTDLGKRAYSGAKKGYLTGLSIGYRTVKSIYDSKDNARHLTEIQLLEGSPVTFPANVQAQITAVKSAGLGEPPDLFALLGLPAYDAEPHPYNPMLTKAAQARAAVAEERATDPKPTYKTDPALYFAWQWREARRKAEEGKWADYAP